MRIPGIGAAGTLSRPRTAEHAASRGSRCAPTAVVGGRKWRERRRRVRERVQRLRACRRRRKVGLVARRRRRRSLHGAPAGVVAAESVRG